ncbi:MAG: alpha/beta fold hydrolase [Bacteroidota bacterium]
MLSTLVITLLLAFIGVEFIAPYAVLRPFRTNGTARPSNYGLQSSQLSVSSKDGAQLQGYWIEANTDTPRGIMMLVHGIGSCKEVWLPTARDLADIGITTIVYDGRAHGQSDGPYCTYGYLERHDIVAFVDHIKNRVPDLPVGIWGNSLGGAVAIQAMSIDARIQFGVIESTFTDLEQIVFEYKKRILKGIGIRFLSNRILRKAGKIAGFPPEEVKPIESVQQVQQPIFLAHGDQDANINIKYGEALFEKLASPDKTFYRVEGGGHSDLGAAGGSDYSAAIRHFIQRMCP